VKATSLILPPALFGGYLTSVAHPRGARLEHG
jgi:hypothetical protein